MVGNTAELGHDEEDSAATIPENDPVINALKLVYTKKYFANSLRLAELVQQEFTTSGRVNRGVKQRNEKGIWVLHATGMPSILVEIGFITNKEEEEYINSEDGQNEIAANITEAVKKYIAALENNKSRESKDTSGKVLNDTLAFLNDKRNKNLYS
jgi:N-acetylmuramoyl-L-alanine amidase